MQRSSRVPTSSLVDPDRSTSCSCVPQSESAAALTGGPSAGERRRRTDGHGGQALAGLVGSGRKRRKGMVGEGSIGRAAARTGGQKDDGDGRRNSSSNCRCRSSRLSPLPCSCAGPAWLMASRISPRISPAPCERDERDMEESKNRHEVVTSLDLGGENQRGKRWEEEINPKA